MFRILGMLDDALGTPAIERIRLILDGEAYRLQWDYPAVDSLTCMQGVPPKDHTLYLMHAVRFHMGHSFPFFHDDTSASPITEFYQNPQKIMVESPISFVRLLVILAFGKALLVPAISQETPSGFDYYLRAEALLRDIPETQGDPILRIEVLALMALYLQAVDVKGPAYTYVSLEAKSCLGSGADALYISRSAKLLASLCSLAYIHTFRWNCLACSVRIDTTSSGGQYI